MSGYSTPCSGELEFWTVMRSQMVAQSKQLDRIATALERVANALEKRAGALFEGTGPAPAESGLPDGSSVTPSPWPELKAALEPEGGGE